MEATDLLSLLEDLDDNIDDLEESLEPILTAALSITTKKLPLLDRAKLHALLVYSIESLLFSYLRLHGVAAKEHLVFRELTRVKQYFQKIKLAEQGPAKPTLSLNKQATGRFIKAALAGNDRIDTERAEREAREKLLAKRRASAVTVQAPQTASESLPSSEHSEDLEEGEVEDEADIEMVDVSNAQPVMNTNASGGPYSKRTARKGGDHADRTTVMKPKKKKKRNRGGKSKQPTTLELVKGEAG